MTISRRVSYTGLALSGLYVFIATVALVLSSDCRGEGCAVQLFVTFPWFFLFLRSSSTIMLFVVSVSLNAILWYLLGSAIGRLGKWIVSRLGRG
ncbi:MAG TPA: hypothetical protein PKJ16_03550 [Spirochaetota bacterium]|nr:hypothetical protein [Spirochaetota bacterium]HPU87356.1 hypothetical protein [Spirochaetota bacterium]